MCRLHTILCVRWGIPPTDMQTNHRSRRKEKEGQWCVKQFRSSNFDIKTSSVNPTNQCQIAIMEKQPHAQISQKKLKETTKILDNFQKQLEENLSKTREIYGKAIKYMDGLWKQNKTPIWCKKEQNYVKNALIYCFVLCRTQFEI